MIDFLEPGVDDHTYVIDFLEPGVDDHVEDVGEGDGVVVVQQRVDRLLALHQTLFFLRMRNAKPSHDCYTAFLS